MSSPVIPVLWHLPVPPNALLAYGETLRVRGGREVSLDFSYEDEDEDVLIVACALVFVGVESFRWTHFRSRPPWTHIAYARLIDLGGSDWLSEVQTNLTSNGEAHRQLKHLAIDFDDGPLYEAICLDFRVEYAK